MYIYIRDDSLGTKPNDKLSEQEHLRQSHNLCGYINRITDNAIGFNKRHNAKTATSKKYMSCHSSVLCKNVMKK